MDIDWDAEICGNTVTPTFWGVRFRSNNYPTSKVPRACQQSEWSRYATNHRISLPSFFNNQDSFPRVYNMHIKSVNMNIRWYIICTYTCSVCLPIYIIYLCTYAFPYRYCWHSTLNTQHYSTSTGQTLWASMAWDACSTLLIWHGSCQYSHLASKVISTSRGEVLMMHFGWLKMSIHCNS